MGPDGEGIGIDGPPVVDADRPVAHDVTRHHCADRILHVHVYEQIGREAAGNEACCRNR